MKDEAVAYAREGASTAAPEMATDYALKYANLLRLAEARRADMAVVSFPGVLGDTYDEILQSLSLLAEQGLGLMITKPQPGAVSLKTFQRQRRKRRNRR